MVGHLSLFIENRFNLHVEILNKPVNKPVNMHSSFKPVNKIA